MFLCYVEMYQPARTHVHHKSKRKHHHSICLNDCMEAVGLSCLSLWPIVENLISLMLLTYIKKLWCLNILILLWCILINFWNRKEQWLLVFKYVLEKHQTNAQKGMELKRYSEKDWELLEKFKWSASPFLRKYLFFCKVGYWIIHLDKVFSEMQHFNAAVRRSWYSGFSQSQRNNIPMHSLLFLPLFPLLWALT